MDYKDAMRAAAEAGDYNLADEIARRHDNTQTCRACVNGQEVAAYPVFTCGCVATDVAFCWGCRHEVEDACIGEHAGTPFEMARRTSGLAIRRIKEALKTEGGWTIASSSSAGLEDVKKKYG